MDQQEKTPALSKKEIFFQSLIKRSEEGKLRLVAEPKLNGAAQWAGVIDPGSALEISVYTSDASTLDWLKQGGMVRAQQLALADGAVKLQLNRGQLVHNGDGWPKELVELAAQEASFGAGKPLHLSRPLTVPHVMGLLPGLDGKEALLVGVDIAQLAKAMDFLRENGLSQGLDMAIHVEPGSGMAWLAAEMPADIAASLRVTPGLNMEGSLGVFEGQSINEWVNHPPAAMTLPERALPAQPEQAGYRRVRQQAPSVQAQQTEAVAPKDRLVARAAAIKAMGIKKTSRLLPGGQVQPGVWLAGEEAVKLLRDGLEDPLRLVGGGEKAEQGKARFYPLSASELYRLEEAVGTLPEGAALPMDMRPVRRVLEADRMRKAEVRHVLFAEVGPVEARRHYMYVATHHQRYLGDMADQLGLSVEQHAYVSSEHEKPALLRVELAEEAWNEAFAMLEARQASGRKWAAKPVQTRHVKLDPFFSLQAADYEARVEAGLAKEAVEPEETAPEAPPLKSGEEAEALFMEKLRAFAPGEMVLARVVSKRKGEEGIEKPVLFISAAAQKVGEFRNKLTHDTSLWREKGEIHSLGGANDGHGAATYSFGLTPHILQQLEAQNITRLPGEPLFGGDAKKAVREHFDRLAKDGVERDRQEMALQALRSVKLVAVRVDAPDMAKLERIQGEIASLGAEQGAAQDIVAGFERFRAPVLEKHLAGKREKWPDGIMSQLAVVRTQMDATLRQMMPVQDAIRGRLQGLQNEYEAVRARGVHTQYLLRDGKDARQALEPLVGTYIEEMEPAHHGVLRLRLSARGEQVVAKRNRPPALLDEVWPFDQLHTIATPQLDAVLTAQEEAHRARMEPNWSGVVEEPVVPAVQEEPKHAVLPDANDPRVRATLPTHWMMMMPKCKGFVAFEKQKATVEGQAEGRYVLVMAMNDAQDGIRVAQMRLLLENEGFVKAPEVAPELIYDTAQKAGVLDALIDRIDDFSLKCRPMEGDKASLQERGRDTLRQVRGELKRLYEAHSDDPEWRALVRKEPVGLFATGNEELLWKMMQEQREGFVRQVKRVLREAVVELPSTRKPWEVKAAPVAGAVMELTEEGARTLEAYMEMRRGREMRFPLNEDRPVDRETIAMQLEWLGAGQGQAR